MVGANSRALELAGIIRGTESPAGGVIETDATGEPTGILKETAQALVQGLVPPATVPERREAIRTAVAALHAEGTTSYTAPGLGPGGAEILGGSSTRRRSRRTSNWRARVEEKRGTGARQSAGHRKRVSVGAFTARLGWWAWGIRVAAGFAGRLVVSGLSGCR